MAGSIHRSSFDVKKFDIESLDIKIYARYGVADSLDIKTLEIEMSDPETRGGRRWNEPMR